MLEGGPQRLAAYFAAAGFALLAVAGLQWQLHQGLQPSPPPYLSAQLPWGRYVLGGLLFGSGSAQALMTGAGAVLGLGCTVGHGLSGLSMLSLGSALGLARIFAGAMGTIWIESRCAAKALVGLPVELEG